MKKNQGYRFEFRDSVADAMDPMKRMMGLKVRDGKRILNKIMEQAQKIFNGHEVKVKDLIKEGAYYGNFQVEMDTHVRALMDIYKAMFSAAEVEFEYGLLCRRDSTLRRLIQSTITVEEKLDRKIELPYLIEITPSKKMVMRVDADNAPDITVFTLSMLNIEDAMKGDTDSSLDTIKYYEECIKYLNNWHPEMSYLSGGSKANHDLKVFIDAVEQEAYDRGKIKERINRRYVSSNTIIESVLQKVCMFNSDRAYTDLYNIFNAGESLTLAARKKLRVQLAAYLLDLTAPVYSIEVKVFNNSEHIGTMNVDEKEVEKETNEYKKTGRVITQWTNGPIEIGE